MAMSPFSTPVQRIKSLTTTQKALLRNGNIKNVSELLLAVPRDLARKLKTSPADLQLIINTISNELAREVVVLRDLNSCNDSQMFTTGDVGLDEAIGGGFRTGMLWEVAGESASGKTQLALQLSLSVQSSPDSGGIAGGTCYITIQSKLPTQRLAQILQLHPSFTSSVCSLADVHTQGAPTLEVLVHILTTKLPLLCNKLASQPQRKPIRLVIIDSIASLFQSTEGQTSKTLFERSKGLAELSRTIHSIAAERNVAFVVINDVIDVFNSPHATSDSRDDSVLYRNQSRWYGCATSVPGGYAKEASLGLVWANHVNARIMLTKTGERRQIVQSSKRQRIDDAPLQCRIDDRPCSSESLLPIRALSIIFNPLSAPTCIDFVIVAEGIMTIAPDLAVKESTFYVPNLSNKRPFAAVDIEGNLNTGPIITSTEKDNPLDVNQGDALGGRFQDIWDSIDEDQLFDIDIESVDKI